MSTDVEDLPRFVAEHLDEAEIPQRAVCPCGDGAPRGAVDVKPEREEFAVLWACGCGRTRTAIYDLPEFLERVG